MNFVIPNETTPTPTATQSPGGGGGAGGWTSSGLIPISENPPSVKLNIMSIKPQNTVLNLEIVNEGTRDWEYIYRWQLTLYNTSAKQFEHFDSSQSSKFVKSNQTVNIPISFKNLDAGKYQLKTDVMYGEYTSKAQTQFEITGTQTYYATQERTVSTALGAGMVVLLGIIAYMKLAINKKTANIKRFQRRLF